MKQKLRLGGMSHTQATALQGGCRQQRGAAGLLHLHLQLQRTLSRDTVRSSRIKSLIMAAWSSCPPSASTADITSRWLHLSASTGTLRVSHCRRRQHRQAQLRVELA